MKAASVLACVLWALAGSGGHLAAAETVDPKLPSLRVVFFTPADVEPPPNAQERLTQVARYTGRGESRGRGRALERGLPRLDNRTSVPAIRPVWPLALGGCDMRFVSSPALKLCLSLGLLLASNLHSTGLGSELAVERTLSSVVDANALHFAGGTWGNCVNGQSFQQEALITFGKWQYATYYDSQRRVCLARRPLASEAWEVIRFEDHRLRGNDTHNVAVVGVCSLDGTIHLAFDHHGSPLHYRVSRPGVALRPEQHAWTAELFGPITDMLEPGKPLARVTYPRFLRTPAGGLQFGCRIGGSGNGDKCLSEYDSAAGRWQGFGAFAAGTGSYGASMSRNAYLNGLTYDRGGTLHVTWCWRETGDPMTNHDLQYAASDDGGQTWKNNAGTSIGTRIAAPLTIDSPGVRVVEIPVRRGLMNTTTQAADSQGRIHVVTFHLPDDVPTQPNWESSRKQAHYFHYWRDDRGQWRRHDLKIMGGRPALWFDAADNAYLVYTGDRFHRLDELCIAAATASSRWQDWKVVHRESGTFTGQPRLDPHAAANHLSVYVQQAPADPGASASPLHVIDFLASPKQP
jgi:hypothetical protein